MSSFTPITGDEETHWAEVQNRLLRPMDGPAYPTYTALPFADPSWQSVLVTHTFGWPHQTEGPESGGWPRRDWMRDIGNYNDPLIWCLAERGCQEIVLTIEWRRPRPVAEGKHPVLYCRCTPDLEALYGAAHFLRLQEADCRWSLGPDSAVMIAFDAGEEWATADGMEEYHLLGGTSEFIRQYFDAAGGEDYVRAWYYHWEMWNVTEIDHGPLYDLVGWPRPVPPAAGLYANSGGDIDWRPMFGDRIKSCGPDTTKPDE